MQGQYVVVLVGVNDLKQPDVKCTADVKQVYSRFEHKIKQIKLINKKCKIFVVPALPTKSAALNLKVMDFNQHLIWDLPNTCADVSHVSGVARFLDERSGLLSESLSKSRDDPLHISPGGKALLVRLMKDAIFARRSGKRDSRHFSTVAKAPGRSGPDA